MSSMLYDDPLHENRASDETQGWYAAAVYAAAVERREHAAVAAEEVP